MMENSLFNWIKTLKEAGMKVTKKEIRNKAKKLSHFNDFKASKFSFFGCFYDFFVGDGSKNF